jgi:hypothetical protein
MATPRQGASVLAAALVTGALAMTGLVTAGSAWADTQSYLNKLRDAGINTPRGELDVLEGGWEACELLAKGFPPDRVIQQALYNSGPNPHYGLTRKQADTVLHFAVTDLCSARK